MEINKQILDETVETLSYCFFEVSQTDKTLTKENTDEIHMVFTDMVKVYKEHYNIK